MNRSLWVDVRISTMLAAVFFSSTAALAQESGQSRRPRTGIIDGIVADSTLAPLAGATISIVGSNIRIVTGDNGRFRISDVELGPHYLVAQRIGFEPVSWHVEVRASDTARVSFSLDRLIRSLDTVVIAQKSVAPRFAEFEARLLRHEATASFTRDDILKVHPVETWQMLSRVPSVKFIPKGANGGLWAVSARGMRLDGTTLQSAPCFMSVMIDGVLMAGDPPAPPSTSPGGLKTSSAPVQTDGVFDMANLPAPDQIHGIEVFAGPSSIPPKYNGAGNNKMCGLIVIWTR